MPRSPLTDQYQRVMSLVQQIHDLPEDERDFILDLFVPLPEQEQVTKAAKKKSAKKSNKSIPLCNVCGYSESSIVHKQESGLSDFHPFQSPSKKSTRATGLQSQLSENRKQRQAGAANTPASHHGDGLPESRCTVIRGDLGGTTCGLLVDHNVHQMTSVRGYHPFVGPSDVASAGATSSPTSAKDDSYAVNSETGKGSASVAGD